jgi:hypothetical protein
MRIRVHVQGIKGSGLMHEGEEASVLFRGVLEVDGSLIEEVSEIEVSFSNDRAATVKPHLMPGSFEVITHTDESWPELMNSVDEQREVRAGSGRILALEEE